MNETSGFYKRDPETGELLFAPNRVCHANFTLMREQHESYTYPVDGWTWFESEDAARSHDGK